MIAHTTHATCGGESAPRMHTRTQPAHARWVNFDDLSDVRAERCRCPKLIAAPRRTSRTRRALLPLYRTAAPPRAIWGPAAVPTARVVRARVRRAAHRLELVEFPDPQPRQQRRRDDLDAAADFPGRHFFEEAQVGLRNISLSARRHDGQGGLIDLCGVSRVALAPICCWAALVVAGVGEPVLDSPAHAKVQGLPSRGTYILTTTHYNKPKKPRPPLTSWAPRC